MAQEIKLPSDTLEKLKESSERMDSLETFLNKAAAGGFDVGNDRERLRVARQRNNQIKAAFFPNDL